MTRSISLFLIVFLPIVAYLQEIRGVVSNELGEPIAFATIYIEELQTGTSANQQGQFSLKTPLF